MSEDQSGERKNWYVCQKCNYRKLTNDTHAFVSSLKGSESQDYLQCPNCPKYTFLLHGWYPENENQTWYAVWQLVSVCHTASADAGWWTGIDRNDIWVISAKLALIHSEVSEALEGARKDAFDDHLPHRKMLEVELADAMIRIADLAGALMLDLAGALVEKMEYNRQRQDHKSEVRAGALGKRV